MINLSRARGWAMAVGVACAVLGGTGIAAAQAVGAPAADFGTPPSGEVPILFNDHHVYTKPDKLKRNRVLAALVKNGGILVPLRSMFEQMGATVSWDQATMTADVSKPGADIKVTVGKPIVTLNGEDRPLDIPPEVYRGAVVVPVRVISEAMGAYVQWVGDKRLVVVRYYEAPAPTPAPTLPPTPRPTAPPTRPPTPPPTAAPAPGPTFDAFVAADYNFNPIVWNEINPGTTDGTHSWQAKGAMTFPIGGTRLMIGGTYQHTQYAHNSDFAFTPCTAGNLGCNTVNGSDANYNSGLCPSTDPGCVTVVGFQNTEAFNGLGQAYVPAFTATENTGDVRLGIKIIDPKIFIGVSELFKSYNYLGYPSINGFGFGLEKLPDFSKAFNIYANAYYYPNVRGNYTYPTSVFLGPLSGATIPLEYNALRYQVGLTLNIVGPLYLDGGYGGDRFNGKTNAPSNTTESSAFAGLGIHF